MTKNLPSFVRACKAARVRSERGARTAEGVSSALEVARTAEGACGVLRGQKQLGFALGQ